MRKESSSHEGLDDEQFEALTDLLAPDEASSEDEASTEKHIVEDFQATLDPRLVDAGWGFEAAKSVEYGKTDQSLLNHVRHGVAALARVNAIIEQAGGCTRDASTLRDAVALFVVHDLHKLNRRRDADPEQRFDIPIGEVREHVEHLGLLEWADSLEIADFHSCVVDHHDGWAANHGTSTPRFDRLRSLVRLADGLASCETPCQAADHSTEEAIRAAYPGATFDLTRHVVDDVKGVLTNVLHAAVADTLHSKGFERLLLYRRGCVYLVPEGEVELDLDDTWAERLFETWLETLRTSHAAHQDASRLAQALTTSRLGFYKTHAQAFVCAGPETVLEAIVSKGLADANPRNAPTANMAEDMAKLEATLPFEVERTRRPVGLARLVHSVKRTCIDPLLGVAHGSRASLEATCDVFGVSEALVEGLLEAEETFELASSGKWEYAYGIAQWLIDQGHTTAEGLCDRIGDGLDAREPDWTSIVERHHTDEVRTDLNCYLRDTLSIGDQSLPPSEATTSAPLDALSGRRRGRICDLCNRPTTTCKGTMRTPQSLTTLRTGGFSNHVRADAPKPQGSMVCVPCQIECSMRETGSSRRQPGRLWFHLVPDYFHTPLTWRHYVQVTERLRGDARLELDRLAQSLLRMGRVDPSSPNEKTDGTPFGTYLAALFENGRGEVMLEPLDGGFDPDCQYGARTFSYDAGDEQEAVSKCFGVFVALALSVYAGVRVDISTSPMPDLRERLGGTFAHLDVSSSPVRHLFGKTVPLSELREHLVATAAIIHLGSTLAGRPRDGRWDTYLQIVRNRPRPGAHLLKRIVQSEGRRLSSLGLEAAARVDDMYGHTWTYDMDDDQDDVDVIAELAARAFDVLRPRWEADRPHAIERVLRESIEAIESLGTHTPSRRDAIDVVVGRLHKLTDRSDRLYPVPYETSEHGGEFEIRLEYYATWFVDALLEDCFDGHVARLKRHENTIADGFYAATRRLRREVDD